MAVAKWLGTSLGWAFGGPIGALIGFAGPRVIKQTIGQDLPPGFQSSDFQKEHGFVDLIVNRKELKELLKKILNFFVEEKLEPNEK